MQLTALETEAVREVLKARWTAEKTKLPHLGIVVGDRGWANPTLVQLEMWAPVTIKAMPEPRLSLRQQWLSQMRRQ
jgi:hypothetical protein